MEFKRLETDDEYISAVNRIDRLMYNVLPGSPEGDELEMLSKLVEQYEQENYPYMAPHRGFDPRFENADLTKPAARSKYIEKIKR